MTYKRFYNSSFLSDFTLAICIEGSPAAQSREEGAACDALPGRPLLCGAPHHHSEPFGSSTPASSPRASSPRADRPAGPSCTACSSSSSSAPPGPSPAPPGVSPSCGGPGAPCTASPPPTPPPQQQQQQQQQQPPPPAAAPSDAAASSYLVTATLPVHGVVLAAASPYFEALLRSWAPPPSPAARHPRTLHLCVDPAQLPAAHALVAAVYAGGALPPALPQHDLMQLLLLADRLDVRAALEAAAGALGALGPGELEWGSLLGIASLPDHLYDDPRLAAARSLAAERAQQLFGDLEAAWGTADGRARWLALPFRAVEALAASDALACTENTLFAALSAWVCSAGAAATQEQRRVLAAAVRVPALTPCYLSYVVMQHAWYVEAVSPLLLARAAAFAAAPGEVRKDLAHHQHTHPADACAPAGGGSSSNGSGTGGGGGNGGGAGNGGGGGGGAPGACAPCGGGGGGGGPSSSAAAAPVLAGLAAAQMRSRAGAGLRASTFAFQVDLGRVAALLEQVAAAQSRQNRTIRSPAHFFGGYEFALQLEITQGTKGATGFDAAKPWSLGVFLTCQVRSSSSSGGGGGAGGARGGGGSGGGSDEGCCSASAAAGADGGGRGAGAAEGAAPAAAHGSGRGEPQQEPCCPQLAAPAAFCGGGGGVGPAPLPPLDYGFVSTAASISTREASSGSGRDKRWERTWEHAMVRHRASWGWPNYLDISVSGWDEAAFERWSIGGQLHLTCTVKLLG